MNPKDEESLKRVINYPARGIGQTTIDKLIVASKKNNLPLLDTERRTSYNRNLYSLKWWVIKENHGDGDTRMVVYDSLLIQAVLLSKKIKLIQ